MTSIEEESIDPKRIVTNDSVPDCVFCPICNYLLWKPESCSSCRQLVCGNCNRTWLQNPSNENRCPFECQTLENHRCPLFVQSLLSSLQIQCRNALFGCTEVVPYDRLEHHENVECEYRTQRCVDCDEVVLRSKLDEHRWIPGLCISTSIKCLVCQNRIEKVHLREHFFECRVNRLIQIVTAIFSNQEQVLNLVLVIQLILVIHRQICGEQIKMARLIRILKGDAVVQQSQKENCSYLYRMLVMLQFCLRNWTKIPFFIFVLTLSGLCKILVSIIGIYIIFCGWMKKNIYFGMMCVMISTFFLSYGGFIFLQSFADRTIIFCITTFSFLLGCSLIHSEVTFEIEPLLTRQLLTMILCCLSLFIMKFILLCIRLYYSYVPTYVPVIISVSFHWSFMRELSRNEV